MSAPTPGRWIGMEFSVDLPEEPPPLSVVIDRQGLAWQRISGEWVRNGAVVMLFTRTDGGRTWPELLVGHGPVTLVYAPPPREAAKSADAPAPTSTEGAAA